MQVETTHRDGELRIVLQSDSTKNALEPGIVEKIRLALREARDCPDLAVVTIESSVKNVFSVGMDLQLLADKERRRINWHSMELIDAYVELLIEIARLPIPTLAIVDGLAVGGGVDIACSCDLLLATSESAFSIAQFRKGVFPWTTSAVLVPRIGVARFAQWALSGVTYGPKQLLGYGVVTQVCKRSELDRTRSNMSNRIRGFDRDTLIAGFTALHDLDGGDRATRLRSMGAKLALNCAHLLERS
jgi:enoyl-CoA hydratase/carnithine racemase